MLAAALLLTHAPERMRRREEEGSKGETAFDYAQGNEKLKGTEALKKLEEASK
jgi:hypothetical protein